MLEQQMCSRAAQIPMVTVWCATRATCLACVNHLQQGKTRKPACQKRKHVKNNNSNKTTMTTATATATPLNLKWCFDDGSGSIESEEFVAGVRRLKGEPKAKDLAVLTHLTATWSKSIDEVGKLLNWDPHNNVSPKNAVFSIQ
eukprot:4933453-Amphidinium_carterae.2